MERVCSKCGGNKIKVEYVPKDEMILPNAYKPNKIAKLKLKHRYECKNNKCFPISEYLFCTCVTCLYTWDEDCLDTKEENVSSPIRTIHMNAENTAEILLKWAKDNNIQEYYHEYGCEPIGFPYDKDHLLNSEILYLEGCGIQNLPKEICYLPNLIELELLCNELTELPKEINLTNLKSLSIGLNPLQHIQIEICQITSLIELDLRYTEINELPKEISNLRNLTKLYLSSNFLTNINAIENLTNLSILSLGENKLSKTFLKLCNLINLTHLDLGTNDLSSVPIEVKYLTNLTSLDLSNNHLTEIPKWIGKLQKLEKLDLKNNLLSALPNEVIDLTAYIYLEDNPSLELTNTQKTWIVDETNIGVTLKIDNKKTIANAKYTSDMENLTNWIDRLWFWADTNKIDKGSFPRNKAELLNLSKLDIREHKIDNLPKEIGNLTNLTEILITYSHIKALPKEIGNLINLTSLELFNSQLENLPAEIGNLSKLSVLALTEGLLTQLPKEIGKLNKLTELNLSSNHLVKLPDEICNLRNLTKLELQGNTEIMLDYTVTEKQRLWIETLQDKGCSVRIN